MRKKIGYLFLALLLCSLSGCVYSHTIDNDNSFEPVKLNPLYSTKTPFPGKSHQR